MAETRSYIVYDGQTYRADQLELGAVSPVSVPAPSRQPNGDFIVPRAADGHFYIAGSLNGFPVVFMVDTGARLTTIPAKLAANAGKRAGLVTAFDTAAGRERGGVTAGNTIVLGPFTNPATGGAVLEKPQIPVLGADVLNRFAITQANGVMALRLTK